MKSLKSIIHTIRGKFSVAAPFIAVQLLAVSCLLHSNARAAEIQEGDTASMINGRYSIEFNTYATKMSQRMMTWNDYTEERRLYKLLQVQLSYAARVATRLSAMEAIYSQVTEEKPRLYAMRQMYMHYKDAYDDIETYWEMTDKITKMRPELASTTSKEVQELVAPYAIQWVKLRRDAFKEELKKIDPEFKE